MYEYKTCFIFYATGTCRKSFARIANYFPLPNKILPSTCRRQRIFSRFSGEKETEIYLVVKTRGKGVRHKIFATQAILIIISRLAMLKLSVLCIQEVFNSLTICLNLSDYLNLFYNVSSTATWRFVNNKKVPVQFAFFAITVVYENKDKILRGKAL